MVNPPQAKQSRKARRPASNKRYTRPAIIVTMTAHVRSLLDGDNLANALKAPRDELASWLGVDDADGRVRWQYGQSETRGKEGVCVVVETTT